jgi:hypothetical protein
MNFRQKPLWLVKILHFEYWLWWAFYLPLFPWFIWQAIRAKSLTFFTNVDPCIEFGGFFGESKASILEKINGKYLPKTYLVNINIAFEKFKTDFENLNFAFPIICKPNVGERGKNVEKIEDLASLQKYFQHSGNFLVQEYINYDIELGVLYYKMPCANTGKITSLTFKEFLNVTGDGKSTIEALMGKSDRARFQIKAINSKMGDEMKKILLKGENLLLEPIGNHCRGTIFHNHNHLINGTLNTIFDNITNDIEGFHYGRFDMKVDTFENLYLGKNIKIMELNGVSADPGHIFDPNYKLLQAYKDIASHWKILADISKAQQKLNIKPIPLKILWPVLRRHFFNN